MGGGTAYKGKSGRGTVHTRCRRCGRHSYHKQKRVCSACGFGKSSKLKRFSYTAKKVNRMRVK